MTRLNVQIWVNLCSGAAAGVSSAGAGAALLLLADGGNTVQCIQDDNDNRRRSELVFKMIHALGLNQSAATYVAYPLQLCLCMPSPVRSEAELSN